MSSSERRRLLIVIHRPDVVTAIVRGGQYRTLFECDPRWQTRYVTRIPRWFVRLSQAWPQRPGFRWVLAKLERIVMGISDYRIRQFAREADIVFAITMSSPSLQEALLRSGATYVLDIIDGLWLPWFRQFGWEHFESMVSSAHGVTCENPYTAEHVAQYNSRVELVPDSPQLDAFERQRGIVRRDERQVILGWIGGKDSVDALYVVYEALERLFAEFPRIHLRILGAPRDRLPRFENVRFTCVERYDQETMVREALGMHIGMYPQFHVQESTHRGTLKAKIYMSAGAATICQRWGENCRLIQDGENGLLAGSSDEWYQQLRRLVVSSAERERMGAAGLATIRAEFTGELCYQRLTAGLLKIDRERRKETDEHATGT
jgi:glycosyltransferase involved in cell wall biosynthesis